MDTILQYENLVRSIISKYTYYGDYEDLYQVGMMGLVKACKNYKESTAKFSTYAYKYILGEVNTFIRESFLNLEKKGYEIYYPEPILCTDNAAMTASAGYYRYKAGVNADLTLNAIPNLKIGE